MRMFSHQPKRYFPRTVLVALVAAGGALALAGIGWRAPQAHDQTLAVLASRVQRAVNAGDAVTMESLTSQGVRNDYRWVREWRQSGNTRPWRAAPVAVFGSQRSLIHISRPQVVQSTSDRLYELAGTARDPRLGREIPEDELVGCHVTDHRLQLAFDRGRRNVTIRDDAHVQVLADRWTVAVVRLDAAFRVSHVQLDGGDTPWRRVGGFVMIPKPDARSATLRLQYEATLPQVGEMFIAENEAALTAYWYPHTGRLPATSDIEISTQSDWQSIAPGEREGDSIASGKRTTRWRNTLPVSFITVAAGRYSATQREADGRKLTAYLLRPSATRARDILDQAESAIRTFSERFAPFPYSSYTVVESETFPAALEAYSFTIAAVGALPGLIVHEVAHTWWGGLVPNTYIRSMWNEAFATYSEGLHQRLTASNADPPGYGAHQAAGALPSTLPLSRATDAMNRTHAAIAYAKGARVLEQIERMLGPRKMQETLHAFVTRHQRGKAADWADFQAAIVAVQGSEWADCLDAWLNNPRVPAFQLKDVRATESSEGYVITGTVVPNMPGFWALIPLVAEQDNGYAHMAVLSRGGNTPFRMVARRRPISVALDPEGLVLRSGGPVSVILNRN